MAKKETVLETEETKTPEQIKKEKSKEAFIVWWFGLRKSYIKQLTVIKSNLNAKQAKLTVMLDTSKDADQKKQIKEEMQRNEDELDKIREELEGQKIQRCLTQIENMKQVKEVIYFGNGVQIITNDITCGGKYNLGSYTLQITEGKIRISRTDGWTKDGLCHPFISNTVPCYGVWNPTIDKALSYGGIYTVMIATIKLLECNQKDNGWYISPAEFYKALNKHLGREEVVVDEG